MEKSDARTLVLEFDGRRRSALSILKRQRTKLARIPLWETAAPRRPTSETGRCHAQKLMIW